MITTNSFKDYILLDAGDKEKLESWNGIILARPEPMALWPKTKPELWEKADAYYIRSNKGGGRWHFNRKFEQEWKVTFDDLVFKVSPTGFKHTGLFPEQAANWEYIKKNLPNKKSNILNLFAYTGAASLAALSVNKDNEVLHLDASKGMNEWAKKNRDLSGFKDRTIRFITDEATKFLKREIKRGHKYDAIIMDPPSYGRGPNNELFKFEDRINELVELSVELLSNNPSFIIINTYTTGYSETVIKNVLKENLIRKGFKAEKIEADEIGIKIDNSDVVLPCGHTCRWKYEGSL